MLPFLSVGSFSVKSYITNLPVDFSIRSHLGTRHPVTPKANMNSISMGNRSFFICNSISIFVFHPPEIRAYCNKQIIAFAQYAAGNVSNLIMEILYYQL